MDNLICVNCGIKEVNGSWIYCDDCENELNEENNDERQ